MIAGHSRYADWESIAPTPGRRAKPDTKEVVAELGRAASLAIRQMVSVPSPPSNALLFRSDDVDELRELMRPHDGEHTRVMHGRGLLGYELIKAGTRRVSLGWMKVAARQTVRGQLSAPCLHFPLAGASTYQLGQREFPVSAGSPIFVAAGQEYTRHGGGAEEVFAIQFDASAVTDELRARRPGDSGDWAFRTDLLPVEARVWAKLEPAITDLAAASEPGIPRERVELCEARVVAALAELLLREAALNPAPRIAARKLFDLETWIDVHLAEPVTLGSLCKAAGVGERALQLAFQMRRGMSPMRFVAERRLAAARRWLERPEAHESVTDVAIGVGFSHLGRFAAMYRRAYGESPSQTLRKGRLRSGVLFFEGQTVLSG